MANFFCKNIKVSYKETVNHKMEKEVKTIYSLHCHGYVLRILGPIGQNMLT